jgi:hypothetical protein
VYVCVFNDTLNGKKRTNLFKSKNISVICMSTRLERLKNKVVLVTGLNSMHYLSTFFVCSKSNKSFFCWIGVEI